MQAVLKLVEEVKRNMNQNYVTGVLFFDFSDAFGTVNRAKLLYKLHTQADELLSEKTICKHSKPWIDTEIMYAVCTRVLLY